MWPDAVKEKDSFGSVPLHYASENNAPLDVIQWLVEMWPDAVREKDSDGCLPLHRACTANAPLDVIQLLVDTWPDSVNEHNIEGSLPVHLAYSVNAPVDVIQLLVELWPRSIHPVNELNSAQLTSISLLGMVIPCIMLAFSLAENLIGDLTFGKGYCDAYPRPQVSQLTKRRDTK
jgi:hypothetical protein